MRRLRSQPLDAWIDRVDRNGLGAQLAVIRTKHRGKRGAGCDRTAHAIESGWVQINQGLGQFPGQSYGGYKQSGIGREYSLERMLNSFTQRKNITINLLR